MIRGKGVSRISLCVIGLCVWLTVALANPAHLAGAAAGQSSLRSVWSAVYTEEQAKRGHFVYIDECARCHAENLMGGDDAAPLAGEAFVSNWEGKTAGDLFDKIRRSMPDDNPGALSKERVADVLSYLLSENGFPAGRQELPYDPVPLKQIRIEAKQP